MAIVAMTPAVAGTVALSAEYNKLITNITDLDTRTTAVEAAVGGGTGEIPRKGGEWYMATSQGPGTSQPINQGTLLVNWTANGSPNGVSHSAGTFTVTDAGLYVITANVRFTAGTGAGTTQWIMVTGNSASGSGVGDTWAKDSVGGGGTNLSCMALRRLPANTGVKLWAYCSTSGATVGRENATDAITGISIYKVGN